MTIRRFTCADCRKEHATAQPGPLPKRCDDCKRRREAHRKRRARTNLTVAPEPEPARVVDVPEPPAASAPVPPVESSSGGVAHGVAEVLAGMDVGHACGPALRALASTLAADVDASRDPKDRVALARELRATLAELAGPPKEAGSGDPFGLDGMRAQVVDGAAS